MPGTVETADPDEIQDWIEQHGGEPARLEEDPRELRVDFGEREDVESISWKEFLEILSEEKLMMVYDQDPIAGVDETSPSEEYDFVKETRTTPEDIPDTERDDEEVLGNMEETST